MSRCFPFPPPGYEKKPRSGDSGDLLTKEKRKERKHKKEKRDKEKSEGKEKKDKDRSKDKHRDKKDRKEKHKDRKKDKDKHGTSEDKRSERQAEGYHDDKLRDVSQKVEEVKVSKFTEELGRRIRDENHGPANPMVENSTISTPRGIEGMGASMAVGKEGLKGSNKMATDPFGTVQRRNETNITPMQRSINSIGTASAMEKQRAAIGKEGDTGAKMVRNLIGSTAMGKGAVTATKIAADLAGTVQRRIENAASSMQRRIDGMGIASAMEMQKPASTGKVPDLTSTEQRRNHSTGRSVVNVNSTVQRKTENTISANSIQKERGASYNMASSFTEKTQRRNDGMGKPVENLTSSDQGRIEGMGAAPAMEKDRVKGGEMVPTIICTERRNDGMGRPVEKNTDKKSQGREKIKENKAEEGKGPRCKDSEWNEKKIKWKDKDRDREKEKEEKMREKGEHKHKEREQPIESGKQGQVDNLAIKPLAPHINNAKTAGATDGNTKKRKEFEINGFLHDTDARPNKLSRTSTSYSQTSMENGRTLELSHIASPCSSIKLGVINNIKAETILDNKENMTNGKIQAQHSSAELRPSVAVGSMENGEVSLRPPHPDSKCLSTIYSVPRMEEWPESDDQEWLFSSENPRSRTKLEADGSPPQVWAETLHIESADVFALPYVIPF